MLVFKDRFGSCDKIVTMPIIPKIKTLSDLGTVVRAVENTLTLKGTIDHLRVHHTIDWVAVRKEAREKGILDPASLDKNIRRSIVSFLCTPGSRRHGGDRQSATFCTKTEPVGQVHTVTEDTSAPVGDDTAVIVCVANDHVPATADPAAHLTGFATQIVRRVVRRDVCRRTATVTTSNGVTKRMAEECEEFTEETEEVSVPTMAAAKPYTGTSGHGDVINRLYQCDPATLSDAVRAALQRLRKAEITNATRCLEITETTRRRELEAGLIFEIHWMQTRAKTWISELKAEAARVGTHTRLFKGQQNPSTPMAPPFLPVPTASHGRKRARIEII
jgi:hypothetical protein